MKKYSRLGSIILFSWALAQSCAMAQCDATLMPYKYRNSADGTTVGPVLKTFPDSFYCPTEGPYCTDDHRDPDGAKYEHQHLPLGFPFTTTTQVQVTDTMSDWAWDADYTSYIPVSGSTFVKNCFAHAADSPTVMLHPGWTQFTVESSVCEYTNKKKSYGDSGHVVVIVEYHTFSEEIDCVISKTSEKNASGGVYTHEWLPLGTDTTQPVRRKKQN